MLSTPRFRKVVAGQSLRLGTLLLLLSALARPDWSWDAATALANITADRNAHLIAVLLGLAGSALMIPATLGAMHMLRDRRTAWAHVGGALALFGTVALGFRFAIEAAVWQMAHPESRRGEMLALLQRMFDDPATAALLRYLPVALGIGLAILALGLRLGEAADPWAVYFLMAGSTLAVAGIVTADRLVHVLGWTLVFGAALAIARRILAASDEEWTHWPMWTFSWTRAP